MKGKSQISMELVITFGFAILLLLPLTVLLYEHTTETYKKVNNNQANLIARKITDSANSVYYLGYPTTVTLKVFMPGDIKKINITSREIIFILRDGKEIVSTANMNLTGSLEPHSGLRYIRIAALEKKVNITENVN